MQLNIIKTILTLDKNQLEKVPYFCRAYNQLLDHLELYFYDKQGNIQKDLATIIYSYLNKGRVKNKSINNIINDSNCFVYYSDLCSKLIKSPLENVISIEILAKYILRNYSLKDKMLENINAISALTNLDNIIIFNKDAFKAVYEFKKENTKEQGIITDGDLKFYFDNSKTYPCLVDNASYIGKYERNIDDKEITFRELIVKDLLFDCSSLIQNISKTNRNKLPIIPYDFYQDINNKIEEIKNYRHIIKNLYYLKDHLQLKVSEQKSTEYIIKLLNREIHENYIDLESKGLNRKRIINNLQ